MLITCDERIAHYLGLSFQTHRICEIHRIIAAITK